MRTRIFALALLPALLPTLMCTVQSLAADATSFDPTKVQITAKATSSIPVGTVISWPVATDPTDMQNPDGTYNWLECNGQSISQTVYPELFAIIGAKVPDYRGLFLRGYGQQSHSQNNGSAVGVTSTTHRSGALGEVQGDAIRNITGEVNGGAVEEESGNSSGVFSYHMVASKGAEGSYRYGDYGFDFDASRVVPTATENRPVNTAVRYFIRARP